MSADLFVTASAAVFAGLIFLAVFQYLEPEKVSADYHPCRGGWHEAYLNQCEAGLLRIPQQPVNTYTNLAYLAAGLFTHLALGTGPSLVFAVGMIYLCVGSTLYHAVSTGWAGMLDVTGIYVVFSSLAVFAAATLLGGGAWPLTPGIMFLVAGFAAFLLSKRFRRQMNVVIGIFLGVTYAVLLLHMGLGRSWDRWPLLVASLVLFALAFLEYSWSKPSLRSVPRAVRLNRNVRSGRTETPGQLEPNRPGPSGAGPGGR
jgi:predicted membrane channel-forming protein YqfA (hemolysin III family)